MEEWLPIFYLMVILKIPVGFLLYIVWWAFKAETAPEEAPEAGGEDHRFGRFRRDPKPPRGGPRRGPRTPGALPLPDCPPGGRTRVFIPPAPARAAAAHTAQRGSVEPAARS